MLPGLLQQFAATNTDCQQGGSFFGIPHWYDYLVSAHLMSTSPVTHVCELNSITQPSGWVQVIILVALACLDIVLRLAGLVAVLMVFYGGIRYVTSHGEPDKTKEAQEAIINALIGLMIALVATAAVSFIGNSIGS